MGSGKTERRKYVEKCKILTSLYDFAESPMEERTCPAAGCETHGQMETMELMSHQDIPVVNEISPLHNLPSRYGWRTNIAHFLSSFTSHLAPWSNCKC